MKFNQFNAFGTILKGQALPEQDKKKLNSYLMLRWLSGNQNAIFAQNEVNRFYDIPVQCQYDMFRQMLHSKVKFIKYPKGSQGAQNPDIKILQEHFKASEETAMNMLELISREELQELREIYKGKK